MGMKARKYKVIVVAGCIALLVCASVIIVEVWRSHRESSLSMRLRVRVSSLSTGATIYKLEATNNRYYPGQDPESMGALVSGTSPQKYPNCQNAGSALLARCLFTDANGTFPVSSYGRFERDMLGTVAGVPNTIVDGRDPPMAILYFPARLDANKGAMRFVVADNARYLNADNCPQDANKVLAKRAVPRDAGFLIVTAGPSGKYFEEDSVRPHYAVIISVLALAVITSLVIIVWLSRTKGPTVCVVSGVLLGSLTGAVVLAVLAAIRTVGQSSQSIEIGTQVSVLWLVVGAVTGGIAGSISVIVYARRKEGQRRGR